MTMARHTKRALAAMAATALLSSGCATNGLGSLPLPAPGIGTGGYMINAVFSNALNLPAHAKVKLAGADVGQLESMVARNYTAFTTLRLMDGVRVPVGSTAELRSATPLGDVFVAIKPPDPLDPKAPLLKEGDTIGLESTAAAATVESVLNSAALLVNGGAVRNFTNFVNGAGRATGNQGEAFGNLINQTNDLLAKLNSRSGQIENALTETAALGDRLEEKNQALTDFLSNVGPATDTLAANTNQIADVIETLGATSDQLRRFPSIAGTDTSGRSVIKDLNTVAGSWNDVALSPDTSLYALNRLMPPIVKLLPGTAISVRASIDRLVLGSIPDAGWKGDVAFHGPKRYDWAKLAGSVKYVLWRLQERVVGTGPNTNMGQVPWFPVGPPLPPTPAEQQAQQEIESHSPGPGNPGPQVPAP
ncbi:MCE family protein [Mycobacterium sp. pUA109]|uniref:MCE family protein n=1 Tax=Mycobacterium sp. pUA109 TaxID=3238982 RepID=UPI00351AFB4B